MALRHRPARRRRGTELIEFALIFPVFLFLFFGIMEYSWYFFQRSAAIEAARLGCQAAAHADPDADADNDGEADFITIAYAVTSAELGRKAGIRCPFDGSGQSDAGHDCWLTLLTYENPAFRPRRIACELTVSFRSLTGFLGTDDDRPPPAQGMARWAGGSGRLLPYYIYAQSSAVFSEAD